jgi:hypothetical protein
MVRRAHGRQQTQQHMMCAVMFPSLQPSCQARHSWWCSVLTGKAAWSTTAVNQMQSTTSHPRDTWWSALWCPWCLVTK